MSRCVLNLIMDLNGIFFIQFFLHPIGTVAVNLPVGFNAQHRCNNCNQKKKGPITSSSIKTAFSEPWCSSDLDLPHRHRPPISLTLKPLSDSYFHALQIKDICKQQQNRPDNIHFLFHSFTQMPS
jgi:hypothetical protein